MGLIIVDGFVITNNRVAAYGGVQVSEEELSRIADQIRHSGVPMLANHDERLRLKPRLLNVDVRPTPSGALGVWVEFETDEEAWKAASDAVGGLRGFSVSVWSRPTRKRTETPPSHLCRFPQTPVTGTIPCAMK